MNFQPPLDDIHFLVHEVLNAPAQLQPLPAFAASDAGLMRQVVDEAGKFVASVIAPLQQVGDTVGCRWVDGEVITPPGFRDAYQAFWRNGWPRCA